MRDQLVCSELYSKIELKGQEIKGRKKRTNNLQSTLTRRKVSFALLFQNFLPENYFQPQRNVATVFLMSSPLFLTIKVVAI
jgi:hypothetical protein